MTDPPVVLGLLLAIGFLLPDVQTFRLSTEGVEFERDTVSEDEDLTSRMTVLERKIDLYREQIGEEDDR